MRKYPACPQCHRGDRIALDSVDEQIEWWTCWRCQLDFSTIGQRQYIEQDVPFDESGRPVLAP